MTEIDEISAHLTVLETVVRQLITHMAVRDDNPSGWVQTRKTLAMSVLDADGTQQSARLNDAMTDFFEPAEAVASDYSDLAKPGTPGMSAR